ncbi:protein phosphatase methylesterase, partial [Nadsonia fulvescens var. elongata DSM 6958]
WCDFFDENFQVLYNDVNNHENGAFNVFFSSPQSIDAPIFIFHHGAGSGALSFALLVKRLQGLMKREKETSAIAFDARGHGATTLGNNVPEATIDYSLDTLTEDFLFLLSSVAKRQKWDELASPPKLIFVGHSLGGAVVTNAALKLKQAGLVSLSSSSVFRNIIGLVVLDVVEGSAIEALQSMNQILSTRPAKFDNINDAIEWHLRTRTLRNKESASVSVPGILKPIIEGSIPSKSLTWITDLKKTEQFWKQWFFGLSSKFLQAPAAKLLILAGTDRLDKDLMIGQMQGKYQLIVFQDSGHFLHEDNPTKTALALIDFFKRNDRSGI